MRTEGIFKVHGSAKSIRELELHMCYQDYNFLTKVESAHTVANYWKRILREMKEPLIPYDIREEFLKILRPNSQSDVTLTREIPSAAKNQELETSLFELIVLKGLLNKLPEVNFNTLRFHMEFFNEV